MELDDLISAISGQSISTTDKIQRVNHALIRTGKISDGFFKQIENNSRMIEFAMKTYFLGVVEDDKELRIKSIKSIKELKENMNNTLKRFKEHFKEHEKCDDGCKIK